MTRSTTARLSSGADAAGREAAQTQFDGTLVLEAGAGTGKTTTLVARILAWSLDRGWDAAHQADADARPERIAADVLDGIVAITFTEAGAAEMASRVASAYARLAADPSDPPVGFDPRLLSAEANGALQERAHHLLGALDHLTVETIHAFCRGLLAAAPLEAGLHPELRVDADLRLTEEIVHEVVDRALRGAYARPRGNPLALLSERAVGPETLAAVLLTLRSEGVESGALEADPLSPPRIESFTDRLGGALRRVHDMASHAMRQVRSGKAPEIAAALDESLPVVAAAEATAAGLTELARALERIWAPHFSKLRSWRRGTLTQAETAELGEVPEFPAAIGELRGLLTHAGRLDPARLDLARRALGPMLAECERLAASRGVATFADLLRHAAALLSSHKALLRREQRRIRQLLVDEFQDTDPLQCEIVRLLALAAPAETRPGLFLVGDPKQSIYGWRDADLAIYDGFVTAALADSGDDAVRRLPLTRNFRSDAPILQEVEAAVAPSMVERTGVQPPFHPLDPDQDGSRLDAPRWAPVEFWVSWANGRNDLHPTSSVDESLEIEATAIARDILDLHHEAGVPWNEIALLFRSMTRVEPYLDALRALDIPFLVARDRQYFRRREVIDAAALVRSVVDPLDHLSLVAWLRSASVGVPDAAWLPLWRSGFPGDLTDLHGPDAPALQRLRETIAGAAAELPEDLPGLEGLADWPVALDSAVTALAELRRQFREESADTFLDNLRRLTLLEVSEGARYQGKYRLANLDKFFRRLESAMTERGNDMQAIVRTLRRSLEETPDAQEAPPKDSGEETVQVLSIHKAKGLEFDHVYLPQLHARTRQQRRELGDAEFDRRWRATDAPEYALLGAPTLGWLDVEARTSTTEAAESVRLLYVAMTRARHRLVALGGWPAEASPVDADDAGSLLDLLHARLESPTLVAELAERCRVEDRSWLDHDGVRWRFPALLSAEPSAAAARGRSIELPELDAMARTAAALEDEREGARRRAARPRSRAASAAAGEKLEALAADEEAAGSVPADSVPGGGDRDVALVVGTAVHRLFEHWRLDRDPEDELERLRGEEREHLARGLEGTTLGDATRRFDELVDRFRAGDLWPRWIESRAAVVGREVPVLLPPALESESPAAAGGREDRDGLEESLHALVGSIDLLLHDASADSWTVVDFKTDVVEGDEIASRASIYHAQEEAYLYAVQQALGLETRPIAELWFLWPGVVWRSP